MFVFVEIVKVSLKVIHPSNGLICVIRNQIKDRWLPNPMDLHLEIRKFYFIPWKCTIIFHFISSSFFVLVHFKRERPKTNSIHISATIEYLVKFLLPVCKPHAFYCVIFIFSSRVIDCGRVFNEMRFYLRNNIFMKRDREEGEEICTRKTLPHVLEY